MTVQVRPEPDGTWVPVSGWLRGIRVKRLPLAPRPPGEAGSVALQFPNAAGVKRACATRFPIMLIAGRAPVSGAIYLTEAAVEELTIDPRVLPALSKKKQYRVAVETAPGGTPTPWGVTDRPGCCGLLAGLTVAAFFGERRGGGGGGGPGGDNDDDDDNYDYDDDDGDELDSSDEDDDDDDSDADGGSSSGRGTDSGRSGGGGSDGGGVDSSSRSDDDDGDTSGSSSSG